MRTIYYLDPAAGQWRKLDESDMYAGRTDSFAPRFFEPDGTLYVNASRGADKLAIFTYDLISGKLSAKPLMSMSDFDFNGSFVVGGKKILGFHYQADEDMTFWFDDHMKALQKSIDVMLPATANRISVAPRPQTPFVLVTSYSDVQPPLTLLYNTYTKVLTKVGVTYGKIDPARMGHKEMVRYPARDGLPIPAYLTLPPGEARKNLPMVVLVHGGPYVRGVTWGWSPESQFLASRGYAVLEPEYRGSTGFGSKHFRAGWKQWGLAMQNDIADGAKWAIAQGIVDPRRICISGGSYGGYAALMGLINDPDLFKCGIDWAGVTDFKLLYDSGWRYWSDISEEAKQYNQPVLVGDLEKDAAQFKATSPLLQAARLKQPVLLAYGGRDMRVPLVHGLALRDAVTTTNPNVEWVVYEDEGHGWASLENRLDFWGRVEKFLHKYIGEP